MLLLCEEEIIGLLKRYRRIDQAPWASRTSICKDMLYAFASEKDANSDLRGFVIEIEESVSAFIVEKANLLFICAVE